MQDIHTTRPSIGSWLYRPLKCVIPQRQRRQIGKLTTEEANRETLLFFVFVCHAYSCSKYTQEQRGVCLTIYNGKKPEIGIPTSDCATRRYTTVHLDFCLRFSKLIGQIGRVPLFGAGPRRYIRSRLFRSAVTAFWRALTASWRQKGKRKQVFCWDIRTINAELPSNPSTLKFRNNQIQIFQTFSRYATMAANVSQQVTITHRTWLSHAHARDIQRETKGQKP